MSAWGLGRVQSVNLLECECDCNRCLYVRELERLDEERKGAWYLHGESVDVRIVNLEY